MINQPALTTTATFHGIEYIITLASQSAKPPGDARLTVAAEEKSTGEAWRGDFSARYIETLAQKAGNAKKFPVFLRMITSAIKHDSDSVSIDIITTKDVETLKSKKASFLGSQTSSSRGNRRYLILTHSSGFDKSHYPLPLVYEECPSTDRLKSTVSRLSRELEETRSVMSLSDAEKPEEEATAEAKKKLERENEGLRMRLEVLERDLESTQRSGTKSRRGKDTDANELRRKLEEAEEKLRAAKEEVAKTREKKDTQPIRRQIEEVKQQLELERQQSADTISQQERDIASADLELGRYVENDRKMKKRIEELEKELEMALTRRKGCYSSCKKSAKVNNRSFGPAASPMSAGRKKCSRSFASPAGRRNSRGSSVSTMTKPSPAGTRRGKVFKPHYSPARPEAGKVKPQAKIRQQQQKKKRDSRNKENEQRLAQRQGEKTRKEKASRNEERVTQLSSEMEAVKLSDIDDRLSRLRNIVNSVKSHN